ncbi:MAG: hypothetical protein WA126_04920 [Thermodesulfovibrionales bacterium]
MDDEKEYQLLVEKKCSSCYKNDWCMLSPYQRAMDCLGPFRDVEDNQEKFREYCQSDNKPKVDLERAAREVVLNKYLRNKKLFDD